MASWRSLVLMACCSLLTACSWFSSDTVEPAKLVDFDEKVDLDRQWFRHIGDQGDPEMYFRLQPGFDGNAIYAASTSGKVKAFDRNTGDKLWSAKVKLDTDLASAVGAGGGLVMVASLDGLLVALNADNGREQWRAQLSGELLSAAQCDGHRVVAQSIDGKVTGLDPATGEKIWTYESSVPALTLRGSATPRLENGVAYLAFPNGRVVALDSDKGLLIWEQQVTLPEGRNELERLIDSLGQPVLSGSDLYVVSYQGNAALLDRAKGTLNWKTKASASGQIALLHGNLYFTQSDDTVTALKMATGRLLWENKQMSNRQLTSPLAIGDYIAVADLEGYIHLLNAEDGQFAGRYHLWFSDGVRNDMIGDGDTLYVLTNGGRLGAYRLEK